MNRIKKILLVDDDSDDRFIFSEALKKIDKKVDFTYAVDGEQALKMLRDENQPAPDIIFLDLNMPRLNGNECLAEIRKINGFDHIPIIILTTSDWPGDIADARTNGASYYLTKPGYKELIQCVAYLLADPEEQQDVKPEIMTRLQKLLRKLKD